MTTVQLKTNVDWLFPELCDVIRLFFGDVPISADAGELVLIHTHTDTDGTWTDTAVSGETVKTVTTKAVYEGLESKRVFKRAAKTSVFMLLNELTRISPPWGSLTGIRPTRLMYEALERGMTRAEAEKWLHERFFVSEEKVSLLSEILDMQQGVYYPPQNSFDLYIGIPFCTTRCAYCSFASGEIGNGKLTQPYVNALKREMELSARLMDELGLKLRAGYVGGGTPTAIKCEQLDDILTTAMRLFPGAVEWTVEAGRPDTIDVPKLRMLKSHNVNRISVNPQTFSDETLKIIGRAHTAQQTLDAFRLARDEGFDHINMDLIAALPGEDLNVFQKTLDQVIALDPESVTVHSLAIKRSSRMHEELTLAGDSHSQADAPAADEMIRTARRRLAENGWHPYYLYRQKYMAGNLENVGYAKAGHACLYNIGNMEETARVLALGAGAITKWVFEDRELRIERAPNVRNIEQYIARVNEMCERKAAVILDNKGDK